ncbi:SDR family NAD(P)-dependent oxidoreductase [Conexibacter arvalis]|uniref:NAD(P)-dependent dehydrogenase (Short-subunit alcohol dehydrogenase family) n=1 Tax=Conexibacter arvalis TaxID=912552 RepID=A0A840I8V1_9ACTN|nr:SDR family NAD(P)-dependent oxidoreductase [Conexibacter arvalis]MBB4661296.1 NAD(P)-dependent dehydrogenase (short-subunit alcohol dehydrogenase family) [Conexibacter arvalis]
MDLELAGKTAVVTGASRGIGLAVAQALAAEGARVVAGARTSSPELAAVAATVVPVDLAAAGGPERLVATALDAHGAIDLLVNNVGGNPGPTRTAPARRSRGRPDSTARRSSSSCPA